MLHAVWLLTDMSPRAGKLKTSETYACSSEWFPQPCGFRSHKHSGTPGSYNPVGFQCKQVPGRHPSLLPVYDSVLQVLAPSALTLRGCKGRHSQQRRCRCHKAPPGRSLCRSFYCRRLIYILHIHIIYIDKPVDSIGMSQHAWRRLRVSSLNMAGLGASTTLHSIGRDFTGLHDVAHLCMFPFSY